MANIDRQIGISGGWIAGPSAGLAMMAAPDYLHLHSLATASCFWLGISVFCLSVCHVAYVHWREREGKKLTAPAMVMMIGIVVFLIGSAWSFWPYSNHPPEPANALAFRFDYNATNFEKDHFHPRYFSTLRLSLGEGQKVDEEISINSFYFEITNVSKKSATNIKVYAIRVDYGPDGVTDDIRILLPKASPVETNTSIDPADRATYKLLEFVHDGIISLISPVKVVPKDTFNRLKFASEKNILTPLPYGSAVLAIPSLNQFGVQKPFNNKKTFIDVAVYANDLEPTFARFALVGSHPLSLELVSQGDKLPILQPKNYK